MRIFFSVFTFLNTYRFDVYLLYVAVIANHWIRLPIAQDVDDPRPVVGVVFALSLAWIYLFNKQHDRVEDTITQPKEMLSPRIHKHLAIILSALAILPIILLLITNLPLWPYFSMLLLGFLYSYPFYNGLRLKNITGVKNIVASLGIILPLTMGLFVYFPPFYTTPFTPSITSIIGLMLLYIAGELLWDIRDIEGDRASNVRTIPVVFGVLFTKFCAATLVAISLLVTSPTLTNASIGILMFFFIGSASPKAPRAYYHALLYLIALSIGLPLLWM